MKRYSTIQATALTASLTSGDTTVYVSDGSSYPDPTTGGNAPYTVLIGYGTAREEICTVTGKPGTNILTVTRGQDGSAATAKNIGDTVVHGVSKRDWDELVPQTRSVVSGGGLTGGGDLSADRTLAVGAGYGITVNADDVAVDTSKWYAKRNRIINGDFSVNQRGFSSISSPGGYGFDRWLAANVGGTVTYTTQVPSLGDLPESARAFARIAVSGQSAAGDYSRLIQRIESVRSLSGKTSTLSFWAKATSGTPKVAVSLQQSFGTGGSPSSSVETYVGQVTLSTTWTRYTLSVSVPSIAGKTLGTGGDDYLGLQIWISAGTAYNSVTGSLGLQSATIDLWGVQLEEGSVATPYEQKSYAEELRGCQRYYWRWAAPSNSAWPLPRTVAQASSTTAVIYQISPPVQMRAAVTPGWSAASTFAVTDVNGSPVAATAISSLRNGTDIHQGQITVASGLAAGAATIMCANSTSTAWLELSAEL